MVSFILPQGGINAGTQTLAKIGSQAAKTPSSSNGFVDFLGQVLPTALQLGGTYLQGRSAQRANQQALSGLEDAAALQAGLVRQNFVDTMNLLGPRIRAGDAAIGQMGFELGLFPTPEIPAGTQQFGQAFFGGGASGNFPNVVGNYGVGPDGVNAAARSIGGGAGGAIGQAVGGPIGGAIGSTIGSAIGGLFRGEGIPRVDRPDLPSEYTIPGGYEAVGQNFASPGEAYLARYGDLNFRMNTLDPVDAAYLVEQGYDANGDGAINSDEFANFHYSTYGRQEGRQSPDRAFQYMNRQRREAGLDPVGGTPARRQTTGRGRAPSMQDRFASFRETPGYQFALTEGIRSAESSAAARSGLLSGRQLERLQERGAGLADQTYQDYFGRLATLAGLGGQATGQQVQQGSAMTGALADIYGGVGDARASSYLTQGAIQAGQYGQFGQAIGNLAGKFL